MSALRGFVRGFWGGRWYEPFICNYDDVGRIIHVSDTLTQEITLDPRTFIQSLPNGHSHCFQF